MFVASFMHICICCYADCLCRSSAAQKAMERNDFYQTVIQIYSNRDANTYNTVTKSITVIVSKADPIYTVPESLPATYKDTLKDVSLPTLVSGEPADPWKWDQDDSTSVGIVGKHEFTATFTPTNTKNYNSVPNVTFDVVVSSKPATDPDTPNTGETTYSPTQTLADLSLPDGWEWAGRTITPNVLENLYKAYYTVIDFVNHE